MGQARSGPTSEVGDSHPPPGLHADWCLAAPVWLSEHSVPTGREHSQPVQGTVGVRTLIPGPLLAWQQVSQGASQPADTQKPHSPAHPFWPQMQPPASRLRSLSSNSLPSVPGSWSPWQPPGFKPPSSPDRTSTAASSLASCSCVASLTHSNRPLSVHALRAFYGSHSHTSLPKLAPLCPSSGQVSASTPSQPQARVGNGRPCYLAPASTGPGPGVGEEQASRSPGANRRDSAC